MKFHFILLLFGVLFSLITEQVYSSSVRREGSAKKLQVKLYKPIIKKFNTRSKYLEGEMDEQRKTQPPVVKYHLRRHVWDIKKKDQLKAMFWRRSFSDQISNETSDMMNKLQKIVQQKKNLFNMEVLLNKRFMLPKLPSIVNMKLEPSKMKKLLMKNFPSLYYPGRSTSLSYYPYEPILQRHTMWGTRPEIAVPWVPRYHRVYKTHLLPYGEGLPETIQIMRSNPIKSTRTENLKKFFYPERGDVGKVIA